MEMTEKKLFHCGTTDDDSQENLIECIKNNDLDELKTLLEEDRVNVNHFYDYPYFKTPLSIACQSFPDNVSADCIQILLNYGADPILPDDDDKNALNYAAESANVQLLEPILRFLKNNDYIFENSTVMLLLIQYIKTEIEYGEKNRTESDYLEIIEALLDYGIDINKADDENGHTAVYLAANYGFKQILSVILKKDHVNLDKYKDHKQKTARDLIVEKKLYENTLPDYCDENENTTVETLFKNLRERKPIDFRDNYLEIDERIPITRENKIKLLQISVDRGLDDSVKFLLDKDTDIDETLLERAVRNGYHKIVKLIIRKNSNATIVTNSLLALMKVRESTNAKTTETVNHNKCLELLLKNKDLKINFKDTFSGKTALHLSALYQQPDITLKLLKKGASLASLDKFDILPIADINSETLKAHLDDCIEVSKNCSNDDVDKNITIRITSLLAPRSNTESVDEKCSKLEIENEPLVESNECIFQEMSVLRYMSLSHELKQLLKHPVIMTFLYLKWYHIRLFFYINLGLYLTFFVSLLTYIMFGYNNMTNKEYPVVVNISYVVLLITYINLLVRELGQLFIYRLRYFLSFENWLEIVLLVVTLMILIEKNKETTIRQLSAVAIVLSAIELLLLFGQFPSLSTNIMMLRTVSYTFFKLLLWYSILLLAFAFSFYTLFQEKQNKYKPKPDDDDEEQNFFLDPGMSLLKTIVMLTGEFDAASIKFSSYPIISHLIFVSFVFLIAIVLFNLLNGLAVSDTQIIKNDAELYDQILRVEHISHIENVLLRNKILFWIPYIKKICLFPSNILKTEIKIYENQNYRIVYGDRGEYEENSLRKCLQCHEISLGKKIQRAIRNLLLEKREEDLRTSREDELKKQLVEMKEQIEIIKALLANK